MKWLRESKHVTYAVLASATALLLWMAFPPVDFGLAAWVALVPWLVLVGMAAPRHAALWSMAGGMAFFVVTLHWLRFVTAAGWITLAFYCALYWPLAAALMGWLRRRGVPLALSAPLLVTALEFFRSGFLTGFPFFFLGHTQYQHLPIIQISDLTGVYGVTFLIVLVNAALAELALGRFRPTLRRLAWLGAAALLVAASIGYGMARMKSLAPTPGPRVLMVQANVSQSLKHSPELADSLQLARDHQALSLQGGQQADMVLWPETMFPAPVNQAYDENFIRALLQHEKKEYREYGAYLRDCAEILRETARATGAYLLIGSETAIYTRTNSERHNSAYLVAPTGELVPGRYDKIHLVVFGEYSPVKLLKGLRPAVMGDDLKPGALRYRFTLPARDGKSHDFGVTICYEDAEANLFRKFVRDGAAFMVNITNDGWFQNSSELDQHLAVCAMRAVENRIGVARNANTGISAIIGPDGRILQRLTDAEGRSREVKGVLAGEVPLSNLKSLYSRVGDVFAWACLGGIAVVVLVAVAGNRTADGRPRTEDGGRQTTDHGR